MIIYLNYLILSDMFFVWEGRLACEWMELEYRKPVNVFLNYYYQTSFWYGKEDC